MDKKIYAPPNLRIWTAESLDKIEAKMSGGGGGGGWPSNPYCGSDYDRAHCEQKPEFIGDYMVTSALASQYCGTSLVPGYNNYIYQGFKTSFITVSREYKPNTGVPKNTITFVQIEASLDASNNVSFSYIGSPEFYGCWPTATPGSKITSDGYIINAVTTALSLVKYYAMSVSMTVAGIISSLIVHAIEDKSEFQYQRRSWRWTLMQSDVAQYLYISVCMPNSEYAEMSIVGTQFSNEYDFTYCSLLWKMNGNTASYRGGIETLGAKGESIQVKSLPHDNMVLERDRISKSTLIDLIEEYNKRSQIVFDSYLQLESLTIEQQAIVQRNQYKIQDYQALRIVVEELSFTDISGLLEQYDSLLAITQNNYCDRIDYE